MFINYKGSKVNYMVFGSGNCCLFLHGWGGEIASFLPVAKQLKFKNVLIDFSPFGESEDIKQPYTLLDYAEMVKTILDKLSIKKCNIICHSFGFRVALLLANQNHNLIDKIIATGGAGLRNKSVFLKFKILKNKVVKMLNKNAKLGSDEYKNLSPIMKQTFCNIVNFDLTNIAKKIDKKVLLIYGKKDKITNNKIAKKFNKLLKNSTLIFYEKQGHFAYVESFAKFVLDCKTFLLEDSNV